MQNKISRRQFLQVTGASAAALLLAGLPVEASAAETGAADNTTQTTMTAIHQHPSLVGAGIMTYS